MRFYLIFGIDPQNKEAVEIVQYELKVRALRFRSVCNNQFKKRFQIAVAIAEVWGFRVGSSIRWI